MTETYLPWIVGGAVVLNPVDVEEEVDDSYHRNALAGVGRKEKVIGRGIGEHPGY